MSKNILLIVTGSISAYKAPNIANALRKKGNDVKIILTKSAQKFITKLSFSSQGFKTYTDEDDWNSDRVLHIDLIKWSDIVLIAPCTANTLAKFANGFADNLATNTLRAVSADKHIYICLSMNTEMYNSKITKEQKILVNFNYMYTYFIPPVSKTLACGDYGDGALADTKTIVDIVCDSK